MKKILLATAISFSTLLSSQSSATQEFIEYSKLEGDNSGYVLCYCIDKDGFIVEENVVPGGNDSSTPDGREKICSNFFETVGTGKSYQSCRAG